MAEIDPIWKHKKPENAEYATPDDLWKAAILYFQWASENPIYETIHFAYQGAVTVEEAPKTRAFTYNGLILFLSIPKSRWDKYKNTPEFADVVEAIDAVIYEQKFVNAAAGMLNANIIMRDLNLSEKNEVSGPNGVPIFQTIYETLKNDNNEAS